VTAEAAATAAAASAGPAVSDAIVVAGLSKSYGTVQAVRSVSFTVRHGEIFALLGPNGAGKTTTLEILEGFRSRDSGLVEVLGTDPGDRSEARALRERIGLVLQDIAVEPYLTVRETIARNAGYYQAPRDVGEVIGLTGLTGQERQKVRNLSGGQKRRLDLALGLIGDPDCCSSTSRPPVSTRTRAGTHGSLCGTCAARGPPSCSPPTTWTRPRHSPTGWR
jgi:ABC-2 type transport system ATP-binding protein